jgi:hypothetical protein
MWSEAFALAFGDFFAVVDCCAYEMGASAQSSSISATDGRRTILIVVADTVSTGVVPYLRNLGVGNNRCTIFTLFEVKKEIWAREWKRVRSVVISTAKMRTGTWEALGETFLLSLSEL